MTQQTVTKEMLDAAVNVAVGTMLIHSSRRVEDIISVRQCIEAALGTLESRQTLTAHNLVSISFKQ
jgi:hypothetical protein